MLLIINESHAQDMKIKIATEIVGGATKSKLLSYYKAQSHQIGGFSGQEGR